MMSAVANDELEVTSMAICSGVCLVSCSLETNSHPNQNTVSRKEVKGL